jgi:hypothetical protein
MKIFFENLAYDFKLINKTEHIIELKKEFLDIIGINLYY